MVPGGSGHVSQEEGPTPCGGNPRCAGGRTGPHNGHSVNSRKPGNRSYRRRKHRWASNVVARGIGFVMMWRMITRH